MADRITVLIVDDSRLFRSALEEALAGQDDIVIVGSVFSGEKALEFIQKTPPDVVTLDVEMPGIDGLATLEAIQQHTSSQPGRPPIGVIMVSAFTRRGADITIKALDAGAFDFVAKPSGPSPEANIIALRDEVLAKIRACALLRAKSRTGFVARPITPGAIRAARPGGPAAAKISCVVIGTSTGGPRALSQLLPELCQSVSLPILIVQHMPPRFTASLAESLALQSRRTVVEASDGMTIQPQMVYVAPGGMHMLIRGPAGAPRIGLNDQPPENGCRPSADVLFRSAATVFGPGVAAVILTGMGRDGTAGLQAIKRAGGFVVAQDEASSVVWGMPGSAVEAGVTNEVLPLNRIARSIAAAIQRSQSK